MYIVLGTCRERVAYWEHVDSVLAARNFAAMSEIATGMIARYPTYIHIGRQKLVDMFLEEESATHLCFVDSDNTIPAEALWALAQRDLPIVGALYFGRRGLPSAIAKRWIGTDGMSRTVSKTIRELMLYHKLPIVNRPQYIKGAPTLKVDVIGFGCTLIKREVIENIVQTYTNAFGSHGSVIGEDAEFCKLAQSLGYDIHVDLGVQLGHLATYQVSVTDFMAVSEWQEQGD
jgi:hypothetical protein